MPSRPRPLGARPSRIAMARRCLIFTRQAVAPRPATRRRSRRSSAAAMCSIDSDGTARGHRHRHRLRSRHRRRGGAQPRPRKGRKVRLVSMPSTTTFDRQDDAVPGGRAAARPSRGVSRWRRAHRSPGGATSGSTGQVIGIDHFGASAPAKDLFKAVRFHAGARAPRRSTKVFADKNQRFKRERDDGNQSGHQRIRAHRAEHSAGAVRGQAQGGDARSSRSTIWAMPTPTHT